MKSACGTETFVSYQTRRCDNQDGHNNKLSLWCKIIGFHNVEFGILFRFMTTLARPCWVFSMECSIKKVKCTRVQALRLCTGRTAHRGSGGIALPFHDRGTRRGWGVSVTPRPLFIPGKGPVSIVQEAGWASGPVWTGAEILAPTGIRSPDRPARSQSLYQLSYPSPQVFYRSL